MYTASRTAHTLDMAMRLTQLRNADLNLLVYFVVLVEENNISHAAKRLRLTQSALSRILQRLRALFQDDLLVRANGTYKPTPRGLDVLKELAILLPQIDTLISGKHFDPSDEEAKFRITAADSLSFLYGPILARRHSQTPNLVFDFSPYNEDRYAELETNSRDLILDADFTLLSSDLRKEVLFEDSLVCAVAKNSVHKQGMSLQQYLHGEHVAVNVLDERQPLLDVALATLGGKRTCTFTVPYFGLALRMVAGSNLIATLPRRMSELLFDRSSVRLVRAPKELGSFRYIMVWHKRQEMDARNIWLRQTMREMTSELLSPTQRL